MVKIGKRPTTVIMLFFASFMILFLLVRTVKHPKKYNKENIISSKHHPPDKSSTSGEILQRKKRNDEFVERTMSQINSCSRSIVSNCAILANVSSFSVSNEAFKLFVSIHSSIYEVKYNNNGSCICSLFHTHISTIQHLILWGKYIYWMGSQTKSEMYWTSIQLQTEPKSINSVEIKQEMSNSQMHYIGCKMIRGSLSPPGAILTTETYAKLYIRKLYESPQSRNFRKLVCIFQDQPEINPILLYGELNELGLGAANDAFCFSKSACKFKIVESFGEELVENLKPGSTYIIQSVYYQNTGKFFSGVVSRSSVLETICRGNAKMYYDIPSDCELDDIENVPPTALNLQCHALSDTQIFVQWSPPINTSEEIFYDIFINDKLYQENFLPTEIIYMNKTRTNHSFKVGTKTASCPENFNVTKPVNCTAFLPPSVPIVNVTSPRAIKLRWLPPVDNSSIAVKFKWRDVQANIWLESEQITGDKEILYSVTDLVPNSGYEYKAAQQYLSREWRDSKVSTAQTSPGEPSYPQNLTTFFDNNKFYLTWHEPNAYGSPILNYVVEVRNRTSPDATRLLYGQWKVADNYLTSKSTRWEMTGIAAEDWYEFRVYAVNAIGAGDKSKPSQPFNYANPSAESFSQWFIIGVCGGLVLVLFVVVMFIVVCRHRKARKRSVERTPEITTIHLSYGTDLQLAQIRHMAELSTNLQGIPDLPSDYMDLLPLYPRDRLTLQELLGKGAFGEVYSGIAYFGENNELEHRVAVKTLREGSTDAEKCEFLMEAYFMSLFNHENILMLHGVCIDNEPQYLILELMEGGDLLRYLREARPNPLVGPKLSIEDLIDICLNIACGCKYLEDQHFVHRDLATRNCLVSTKSYRSHDRIVKIGDFGLARDIYKNDYYLKEGEGLLPVRWMAPESLVDNIYTVQTDIWAFGVIIWEAMTFGQQPYPARNNMEVLQFVRGGGRLEKPPGCPDDIYALMRKCWHNTPSLRPSFSWAVQWMQDFLARYPSHNTLEDKSMDNNNETTYMQVHSSDDEVGVATNLPLARSEQRFTAAAFTNQAFNADDVDRPSIEGSTGTSGNGSNYFKVLKNDDTWNNTIHNTTTSAQQQQEINYSVLGFPRSRNQSSKSHFGSPPSSSHLRSKPLGAESETSNGNTRSRLDSKLSWQGLHSNQNDANDFLAIVEEGSQSSLDFPVFSDYFQTNGDNHDNSYAKFTTKMLGDIHRSISQNSFENLSSEEVSTVFDEPWQEIDDSPYMKYNKDDSSNNVNFELPRTANGFKNGQNYAKVGHSKSESSNLRSTMNDSAYLRYGSDHDESCYSRSNSSVTSNNLNNVSVNEDWQKHTLSDHRKRRRMKLASENVTYV